MGQVVDVGDTGHPSQDHACERELPSRTTIRRSNRRILRKPVRNMVSVTVGTVFQCSCGCAFTYRIISDEYVWLGLWELTRTADNEQPAATKWIRTKLCAGGPESLALDGGER